MRPVALAGPFDPDVLREARPNKADRQTKYTAYPAHHAGMNEELWVRYLCTTGLMMAL